MAPRVRRRHILTRTVACVLALGLFATMAFGASPRRADESLRGYYLALGDSLTYGFQPDKVSAGLRPAGFHSGFVDVFAARLRAQAPKIEVVNYGCPGESTITFTRGGCPWLAARRPLHKAFQGSQMSAALAFLTSHRGRVSPITLTLGGNDATALSEVCNAEPGLYAGSRAWRDSGIRLSVGLDPPSTSQGRAACGDHRYRGVERGRQPARTDRSALPGPRPGDQEGGRSFERAVRRHASGLQSVRERYNGEGPNLCSDLRLFTGRRPSNRCRVQSDGGRRPGRFVPHSWEVGASARLKQSPWTGAGTTACPQERVTASTPVDH